MSQLKAAGAPQSDTMQPFTLLTLDILSDNVRTLGDAITNFTRANTLEGELQTPFFSFLQHSMNAAGTSISSTRFLICIPHCVPR